MSELNFRQDYLVYTPKREGIYPLPESDWQRLKGLIKKVIPEKKVYNIISSLSFGIFVSSIFSVITFYTIDKIATWIIPTNWAILIGSLIIGISLLIIDNQQKGIITLTVNLIIEEMDSLEKKYIKCNEDVDQKT